ncbi:hypothetical protein MMC28_000460 [Mycoblastus sanguinarius]|nr:hypothetical protein [Mycoblastus sanguinarius]
MSDSDGAFEPQPIKRTNSGSVIVLDLGKGTLTTIKSKELDINRCTNQATAPKWRSRASIYERFGSRRMIATVNLDQLDWVANIKRHLGLISEIYVMEQPKGQETVQQVMMEA